MANREQRSNRETRKPKKDAGAKSKGPASVVQPTFAPAGKPGGKKK
jgi:hypothetical protein